MYTMKANGNKAMVLDSYSLKSQHFQWWVDGVLTAHVFIAPEPSDLRSITPSLYIKQAMLTKVKKDFKGENRNRTLAVLIFTSPSQKLYSQLICQFFLRTTTKKNNCAGPTPHRELYIIHETANTVKHSHASRGSY